MTHHQLTASNGTTVSVDIAKGQSGWQAQSHIELGDKRVLTIRTSKSAYAAGLRTNASVCIVEGHLQRHVLGFGITGDFRQDVLVTPTARVTEKAVREQHERFLSAPCALTDLLGRIEAHYVAQAQHKAAQARNEVAHA